MPICSRATGTNFGAIGSGAQGLRPCALSQETRADGLVDVARGDARRVDLEVHVRAEGAPGHADRADGLAAGHVLADLDRHGRHVGHQALGAVGVLDRDVVAGPAARRPATGVGHDPGGRGAQRGADRGGEVEAGVVARPAADLAERRGDPIVRRGEAALPFAPAVSPGSSDVVVEGFSPAASRLRLGLGLVRGLGQLLLALVDLLAGAAAAILSSVLASSSARWSARLLTLAGSRGVRMLDRLVTVEPSRGPGDRGGRRLGLRGGRLLRVAGEGERPGHAETEDGHRERGRSVLDPAAPVVADVVEERSLGVVALRRGRTRH